MADQAAAAGLGLPPEDGGGPASQQGMRRQNLGRVMHAIAARGPVSRAELADSTGLTRAAVGSLVGELQAAGLVTDPRPPAPPPDAARRLPGRLLRLSDLRRSRKPEIPSPASALRRRMPPI